MTTRLGPDARHGAVDTRPQSVLEEQRCIERARLLRSAAQLIATRGHQAVTTTALATATDLDETCFGDHFVDTDDLIRCLIRELGEAQRTAAAHHTATGNLLTATVDRFPYLDDAAAVQACLRELQHLAHHDPIVRYGLQATTTRTAHQLDATRRTVRD